MKKIDPHNRDMGAGKLIPTTIETWEPSSHSNLMGHQTSAITMRMLTIKAKVVFFDRLINRD